MSAISQGVRFRVGDHDGRILSLKQYLQTFGYYSRGLGEVASLLAGRPEAFDLATASALRRFQRFHGLAETGQLDEATAFVMNQPRCGLPDVEEFVLEGRKWEKRDLTYAIENHPQNLALVDVRNALSAAFELWAGVTPLRFAEVSIGQVHDIRIRFTSGDHGDGVPFDGSSGILAHAFYPPPNSGDLAGDAHFDTAETWSLQLPPAGIDLVTVAAHEFGHSLGLRHSDDRAALMFPTYLGPHRYLAADDVSGIRAIYGSGFLLQTGTALHETDDTFDFALAENGDLFAFKRSSTGTRSTEIHVLSAASNYQHFILQTGTALHETDDAFAFALAPNRDVFAIKKRATGTNSTEVHVLSAASNYQRFILQTGTALHETANNFAFGIAPNRDS